MKVQPSPVKSWLYSNLWNIGTLVFVLVSGAIFLQTAVEANAQAISRLEQVVAQYPSEDWFNLKFETIAEQIEDLENQ